MRSKADETLVIVATLICPLQVFMKLVSAIGKSTATMKYTANNIR